MPQQIRIDPEKWARVRRHAFDTQMTASALVEAAIDGFFEIVDRELRVPKDSAKPPARLATSEPPKRYSSGDPGPMPWDPPAQEEITPRSIDRAAFGLPPGGGSVVADAVIPVIEGELRGHDAVTDFVVEDRLRRQDALPPPAKTTAKSNGPIIVNDSKEAAALMETTLATRYVHPFTPVPKPVSKPKARR